MSACRRSTSACRTCWRRAWSARKMRAPRRPTKKCSCKHCSACKLTENIDGKRPGHQTHAGSVACDEKQEWIRPFHYRRFPAGDENRWGHDAGDRQALVGRSGRDAGSRHHERSADQGIRFDQGMQLRDRASRHRPFSRQRVRAAGAHGLRIANHHDRYSGFRQAEAAGGLEGRGAVKTRPGHHGGRYRFRQIHIAGGHAGCAQQGNAWPHHHHRGSGRIRASAYRLPDHATRSGCRYG